MKIDFEKFFGKYDNFPDLKFELIEEECARGFGLSLKRLRRLNKLTLDELSEKVEIPNPTLNRYESGYNLPSVFMAMKIVNYFDTNIEMMIFAGLLELDDIKKGIYKEENKYIELFTELNKKLNNAFNNKTTVIFNDHKRKYKKR